MITFVNIMTVQVLMMVIMALAFVTSAQPLSNGRDLQQLMDKEDKRFSMNYQDHYLLSDHQANHDNSANSGAGNSQMKLTSPMDKRFTMNFQDTIDNSDPRSWQNTMFALARSKAKAKADIDMRREDFQKKRSRSSLLAEGAFTSSMDLYAATVRTLETMDQLFTEVIDSQGLDGICKSPAMRKLIKIRAALLKLVPNHEQPNSVNIISLC